VAIVDESGNDDGAVTCRIYSKSLTGFALRTFLYKGNWIDFPVDYICWIAIGY